MATYRKEQIAFANWITYLTGLDNRIVASGENTVSIDSKFTMSFYPVSSGHQAKITVNGNDHTTSDWYQRYANPFIETFIDANYIIIKIWSSTSDVVYFIAYIKDNNGNFFAGIGDGVGVDVAPNYDISSVAFYNVTDGVTVYNIKGIVPFKAAPSNIAYSNYEAMIDASNNLIGFIQGFLSSSIIPVQSNISLPNGKNYYAIGKNSLIEINS